MSTTASTPATIDFTVPEDLRAVLERVRAYLDEDVRPAEADITDPEDSRR